MGRGLYPYILVCVNGVWRYQGKGRDYRKVCALFSFISVMKNNLILIIICLFCFHAVNAEVTWSLEYGTLTISGTGDMDNNYYYDSAPWYNQRGEIFGVQIEEGVTSIGDYAFCDCYCLSSVSIPNTVRSIGEDAFCNCYSLESITIPNSVTSIAGYAFANCVCLSSVVIPSSVTHIGDKVFRDCANLKSIVVESDNNVYDSRDNCNAIIRTADNTLVCGCKGTTIPNSVTTIGPNVFPLRCSPDSITIPNNVTRIAEGAFYEAYVTSVNLPNSIACIEDVAFMESHITSITIPNSVTSIGKYAFEGCFDLSSVVIPNSVKIIGYGAFECCTSLTSVIIPNSVINIDTIAFQICPNLKEVTIDVNKDLYISIGAFRDSGIEKITMYGKTLPNCTDGDFLLGWDDMNSDLYSRVTLSVPPALYDEYCSNSPWNQFGNIVMNPTTMHLSDGEQYTNNSLLKELEISYTRTFNNTSWQSLYIPFSMSYDDWKDDFDVAYINGIRQIDTNNDNVIDETIMDVFKIEEGSLIPNTPYLIRAKTTGEKTISVSDASLYQSEVNSIDCSTSIAKYTITGTYNTIPASTLIENEYYAMGGGSVIMTDGESDLKPFRWYLKAEARSPMYNVANDSNAAKTISINVLGEESETTGIHQVSQNAEPTTLIYDLNGRAVNENSLKSGMYIKNGKKLVIK